jgi:hypothetical protein
MHPNIHLVVTWSNWCQCIKNLTQSSYCWLEGDVWLSVHPSIRPSILLPASPSVHPSICCSHLEHRAPVKRFVSFHFLDLRHSVGLLGWGICPLQGHYLHRTTQTWNKRRQTSMPWVGFKPTIPMFEQVKTFHALDCGYCDWWKVIECW